MMKKQKMDFKVIQQWITYQLNHLSYNHIIISTYDVLYIDEMSTMFVLYIGLINIQYIQYIYTCYTYTICIYFSCILCNLIYYTFNMVTWNTLTHDTITPSPPHLSPCYYIYIYMMSLSFFGTHENKLIFPAPVTRSIWHGRVFIAPQGTTYPRKNHWNSEWKGRVFNPHHCKVWERWNGLSSQTKVIMKNCESPRSVWQSRLDVTTNALYKSNYHFC